MLIAIPVSNDKLDPHFGHCKKFALIKMDPKEKKILSKDYIDAPPHQPGLLPSWLKKLGVDMVIAGGIGARAKDLLAEYKIEVLVGAPKEELEYILTNYLAGTLKLEDNCCDH